MNITAEEIESKKTAKGGWTKKQLAEWGISWPPVKGWKTALINGTHVPEIIKVVKADKKKEEDEKWYRYLLQNGFKRIIQVSNGKVLYDGLIERLSQNNYIAV